MANPERPANELPAFLRWRPGPIGDPIDMEFVLREVEEEQRGEALAAHLETVANVYRNIAEGATRMAKIVRGEE